MGKQLNYDTLAEMPESLNHGRILLAAAGGFIAYFSFGFLSFGALPYLRDEYAKYPAVYRNQKSLKGAMPVGMAAMFVAMVVLAVPYALSYQATYGHVARARLAP